MIHGAAGLVHGCRSMLCSASVKNHCLIRGNSAKSSWTLRGPGYWHLRSEDFLRDELQRPRSAYMQGGGGNERLQALLQLRAAPARDQARQTSAASLSILKVQPKNITAAKVVNRGSSADKSRSFSATLMPAPFGRANEALRKLKTLVAPSATSLQIPGDDPLQTELYGCSTSPAECVSWSALSAARRSIDPEASPPRSGLQGRAVHHTHAPPGNPMPGASRDHSANRTTRRQRGRAALRGSRL